MTDPASAARISIQQWLKDYPAIFSSQDVPHGLVLTEIDTKKSRTILFPEISQWRRKSNPEGLGDYLNLVFEDKRELILCHAGFAFAPSYVAGQPTRLLPPVVCFQDYHRLKGHLDHLYRDQALEQLTEIIQTLMQCLAILAGAKLVGLDIEPEEKDLEVILNWLEKQPG